MDDLSAAIAAKKAKLLEQKQKKLGLEWVCLIDHAAGSGRTADAPLRGYYYHIPSKKRQWERPEGLAEDFDDRPKTFMPMQDGEGRVYYFNTETKESQWEVPAEYKAGAPGGSSRAVFGGAAGVVEEEAAAAPVVGGWTLVEENAGSSSMFGKKRAVGAAGEEEDEAEEGEAKRRRICSCGHFMWAGWKMH